MRTRLKHMLEGVKLIRVKASLITRVSFLKREAGNWFVRYAALLSQKLRIKLLNSWLQKWQDRLQLHAPRLGRRMKRLLFGSFVLLALLTTFWFSLPDPLFQVPYSALLTDKDGHLLSARIARDGQWRFPLVENTPERFSTALVAFEDRRFFYHPGVDPISIARAVRDNLRSGSVVSGASTLSMQVIRMARGNRPRTFPEKLVEAVLAIRLELSHSKGEILALYAAHAPFGGNVVGLEAAAWRYFGRSPNDLTWAEHATLAVLPNAPGLVHPARSRTALQTRRNALLKRLHLAGSLDRTELALALLEPLPRRPLPLPQKAAVLLERLVSTHSPQNFRTTLDGHLQSRVEAILATHLPELKAAGIHNAAALVIDNHTMQPVAYAGNTGRPGMQGHGYALDLIQAKRSTGSLLKPFLFAAMLEAGELQPDALVPDVPLQYNGFRPENFDKTYRGAVRAKTALAQSLNVPAAVLLYRHGVARFQDMLKSLGMTTLFRAPDDYGLSLVLGGSEGTLYELTSLYANLARITAAGRQHEQLSLRPPQLLINAPTNEPARKSSKGTPKAPFGAGASWLTLKALLEVNRPGMEKHWQRFTNSRKIAWKTGTSYGLRDGWAIGTTPLYTVGVWSGNASGEGRAGLTGGSVAAPILFDIFGLLETGGWWDKPEHELKTIEVCEDDGYLPSNGCQRVSVEIPRAAHFNAVSRRHRWLHLGPKRQWQVHAGCESVSRMQTASWFVLPPIQEYFYRQHNPSYRVLPPMRPDCGDALASRESAFDIVYPESGSGLVIPTDFGGMRGRVVMEAKHRNPNARLYWHLDGRVIATTMTFHEVAVDLDPGLHRLTLVDQNGERQSRSFRVHGVGAPR